MKKMILILLVVFGLAIFLSSCNKSPSEEAEGGKSQVQKEEKDIKTESPEEETAAEETDSGETETKEENSPQFTPQEQILGSLGFEIPTEAIEAPDFSLPMISPSSEEGEEEGETKLSDFKGKVVFLNFWATWCPPCRKEMPSMEELWKDYKDKDFVILAVNLNEDRTTVSSFLEEYGYTFPVLLDSTGDIGGTYGVQGIPTSFLIDKNGFVLGRLVGTREWNTEDVRSAFSTIVDEPK